MLIEFPFAQCKPLGVIWGKFPQYNSTNTIMFDDIRRNFLMNPQNGLRIEPFKESYKNRATDKELYYLAKYLRLIAEMNDLSSLNHKHWRQKMFDLMMIAKNKNSRGSFKPLDQE